MNRKHDKTVFLSLGVHGSEANAMEPMSRIVLEKAVEAIMDAGFHPSEFEGTRTGLFVSSVNSDRNIQYDENLGRQHYTITG